MLGQIDTHSLRCHLVIADSLEGTTVGRVDDQHDNTDADAGNNEREQHAVEVGELPQQVRGVGQRAHLVPLDDSAHDLSEAQRGNGQIIGLQLQHRQTDKPRKQCRHHAGQDQTHRHGQAELHDTTVKVLVHGGAGGHGNGQDCIRIRTDHHKARLSQREQARKAVQ